MAGAVIGIDPGIKGGIALITDDELRLWDMPFVNLVRNRKRKQEVSGSALADILWELEPLSPVAYLEKVGAMPGQGVTSMFSFGQGFGVVLGVLHAIGVPVTLVPPQTWTAKLKVRKGKAGSALAAQELYPGGHDMWHGPRGGLIDGRVEAVLIAHYGRIIEDGM